MTMYRHMAITTLMLIITSLYIYCVEAECDGGFFGHMCQYKCHCIGECDEFGGCLGTLDLCESSGFCDGPGCDDEDCHDIPNKCEEGWFGLACQHQNLAHWAHFDDVRNHAEKLLDIDDGTCISDEEQNITLRWSGHNVFTWLRVVVKNESQASDIKVNFRHRQTDDSPLIACNNQQVYLVQPHTLDIRCDLETTFEQIIITGRSICGLYVNGGRNVALLQSTNQSSFYVEGQSTWSHSHSRNTVDGSHDHNYHHGSCFHTGINDTTPFWEIKFSPKTISRYVIYNRLDDPVVVKRLTGFNLKAFEAEEKRFEYFDTTNEDKKEVKILDKSKNNISRVLISNTKMYLHFCEVEIFGECPAGTWGLNCTPCPSSCPNDCHLDTGECSAICFGFEDPPNCKKSCSLGKWGINCRETCTIPCVKCHHTTGQCLGCRDGFKLPDCSQSCDVGTFGPNCSLNCSNDCLNKQCDPVTGHCFECEKGRYTPNCKICQLGSYGNNCSQGCSAHCSNSYNCDPVNGTYYDGCKDGYTGSNCLEEQELTHQHVSVPTSIVIGLVFCLAAAMALLLVLYKKRENFKRHKKTATQMQYNRVDEHIDNNSRIQA